MFAAHGGVLGGSWHSIENSDVFSAAGMTPPSSPSGTWTSTDSKDSFAARGDTVGGVWSSADMKDQLAFEGNSPVIGSWSSTENTDMIGGVGIIPVIIPPQQTLKGGGGFAPKGPPSYHEEELFRGLAFSKGIHSKVPPAAVAVYNLTPPGHPFRRIKK